MRTRRETLLGALALSACTPTTQIAAPDSSHPTDPRIAAIEARIGGRVGVAALNLATHTWIMHRAQERFAMCSTFKWLLAAQVLNVAESTPGLLQRRIRYGQADLLEYAPTTRTNLERGWMTIEGLCEAAVVVSDNTAANLLLAQMAGPQSLTYFLREHGDEVTRLDRIEPELNENLPGDERDTTTPAMMAITMRWFLLGQDVLSTASREKLIGWMVASTRGLEKLRAGLPATWRVGDKTGVSTGLHNATNDVAIAWPPGRDPVLIACYLSESTVPYEQRNAAHAEIARIIAAEWG
jgi:beta-lactamase class A